MFEGLVQRSFAAINNRDWKAHVGMFADDAVLEFPGPSRIGGRVGKAAIEEWWRRWCEGLSHVHFTVTHVGIASLIGLGLRNIVFVEWNVEATARDGPTVRGSGVSVVHVRRGRVAFIRDYLFDPTIDEILFGRAGEAGAA